MYEHWSASATTSRSSQPRGGQRGQRAHSAPAPSMASVAPAAPLDHSRASSHNSDSSARIRATLRHARRVKVASKVFNSLVPHVEHRTSYQRSVQHNSTGHVLVLQFRFIPSEFHSLSLAAHAMVRSGSAAASRRLVVGFPHSRRLATYFTATSRPPRSKL